MLPRVLAVAVLALALSGCSRLVEFTANSLGLPTPAKVVADKSPPNLLIAQDGTTCRVPEARYRRIGRGDQITCIWTGSLEISSRPEPRY